LIFVLKALFVAETSSGLTTGWKWNKRPIEVLPKNIRKESFQNKNLFFK